LTAVDAGHDSKTTGNWAKKLPVTISGDFAIKTLVLRRFLIDRKEHLRIWSLIDGQEAA